MGKLISPFYALLTSIWLINLGGGLQSTILGMRADMESFGLTSTGLIMSAYFLGYMVSFFLIPPFINSVGHIRSFAAFASLSSAATILHAVFVDPITWGALRALTGLCFGGLILVGESWLNASSSNENRGSIFAIYMLVILSAAALSQMLINLTPVDGYDLFILVSVALSLSVIPLSLGKKIIAPDIQESSRMALGKLIKTSPLGVLGVLVSGLVNGSLWMMMAVFAVRAGLETSQVSTFMFVMMIGGMLSLWPVGKISDIIDRRKIILSLGIGGFVVSTLFVTLPTSDGNILVFALAGLIGFAAFPLYAIASSHINDHLEEHEFVPACGSLILIYGIGALFSPIITARFMDMFGPDGMFIFFLCVHGPMIVFALYRIWQKDVIPVEERTDFVFDMPKATPTVSPLDPRNLEAEEMAEEVLEQNLDISEEKPNAS